MQKNQNKTGIYANALNWHLDSASALTINVHHQRPPPSTLCEPASNCHDTHCDDVAEPLWEPSISRNPLHFTHSLDLAQCMADTSSSSSILIGPGASGPLLWLDGFKRLPPLCVSTVLKVCSCILNSAERCSNQVQPLYLHYHLAE